MEKFRCMPVIHVIIDKVFYFIQGVFLISPIWTGPVGLCDSFKQTHFIEAFPYKWIIIYKIHCRYAQRLMFMAILNPINLTTMINHWNYKKSQGISCLTQAQSYHNLCAHRLINTHSFFLLKINIFYIIYPGYGFSILFFPVPHYIHSHQDLPPSCL